MQPMQAIFNTRMEPVRSHEEYPKYARSGTKPVVRARHIIDQGVISERPCSTCVELKQDCYRWEGTFSKCAFCTSKDKRKEMCHVPGEEASPAPERRKRRKITGNIYAPGGDAVSNADTKTYVSDTLASAATPFPNITIPDIHLSSAGSVRPSPDATCAMTGIIDTHVTTTTTTTPPPPAAETACLERVTALESQVSNLEAKVLELLVKVDEVSSCVGSSSTSARQAVAGTSATSSNVSFEDLQAQDLAHTPATVDVTAATRRATREWVEGPETTDTSLPMQIATEKVKVEELEAKMSPKLEHAVEHPEEHMPVDCSGTGP